MKPVVAIICDTNSVGTHLVHQVAGKYIQAVRDFTDATPILLPALDRPCAAAELSTFVDGVLLTGGYSNIERQRYGLPSSNDDEPEDPLRDMNALSLVQMAYENDIPVLGICRGMQEINVAFGGTLHPEVHLLKNRMDHREDRSASIAVQYGAAHSVKLCENGLLESLLGKESFAVNSLHGQAVNRLGRGLCVEAVAEDGSIEAISTADKKTFFLGVQWHPEWQVHSNLQSRMIFEAFGQAAKKKSASKV